MGFQLSFLHHEEHTVQVELSDVNARQDDEANPGLEFYFALRWLRADEQRIGERPSFFSDVFFRIEEFESLGRQVFRDLLAEDVVILGGAKGRLKAGH